MTHPHWLLLIAAPLVSIATGCSSSSTTEATNSPEDRKLFEERKYRDPALGRIPDHVRTSELQFASGMPGAFDRVRKGEALQALAAFQPVGPWNIGGRTRALAYDVDNSNILLAGGVSGGLWRSEDAGTTWSLLTPPDQLHTISSIIQDNRPGKHNIWYYGTGESYGNSARITGNGIWKSTDGAKTFRVLPSTVSATTPANHAFAYSWRLAVDPGNGTLYDATTRTGIHKSADEGATWSMSLNSDSYFTDVAITGSGVKYAALSAFTGYTNQTAAKYGIFRSTDGVTWVNISPTFLTKNFNRAVIGVVPGTDKIFVIAETPGEGTKGQFHLRTGIEEQWHSMWSYEYLSGDGTGAGGRWVNRSANVPLFGGRVGDFISQSGYDLIIRISPHDTNNVVVGGTNLYVSTDAFRTNTKSNWIGGYGLPDPNEAFPRWPNHHSDQHDVLFHPTQALTLLSANDGGVMRTTNFTRDTVQWTSHNMGYLTTQHYAVAMRLDAATDDIMGAMQDNGTWATNVINVQTPWFVRNGGDGAYGAFAEKGRTLIVSTQQARIRRVLLDATGKETARTRIDPIGPKPSDYLFINPFALDPNNEKVMYLPAGGIIYRNSDLSAIPMGSDDSTSINWDTLASTRLKSGQITTIAATVTPANVVYYGTSAGKVYKLTNANVGQPAATDVSSGLPAGSYLNALTVDPRDGNRVLAAFSNYGVISIYYTANGGTNWTPISGNLEETPTGGGNGPAVNWVDVVPYNATTDVYVAATSTGMYMTSQLNGMSTVWTQIAAEEIGNVPIDMVMTRHLDKRILVATHGRGVFVGKITDLPPATTPPTLLSPPNLTRGIRSDTTLVWNAVAGAVSYRLEVCARQDFSDSVIAYDGVRTTSQRVTGLKDGPQRYYWRVTAFAGGGRSEPSEVWSFSTVIRPPVLLSPENRAENVPGLPVALGWERVPGATSYDVQVGNNLAFSIVLDSAYGVADTTALVRHLASNTRYYWHVRSTDPDATGEWSARSQFTTGTLTSVLDDEWKGAEDLRLTPNPATEVVTLQVAQVAGTSTVEVVNSEGAVVLREQFAPGSTQLNVRQLAAGTYTVRVATGAKRYIGRMSVVR
jgi:hypothetical protein